MKYLGISNTGSLLIQEAHLANNSLLSSFDLLLKANLYQEKEGFFYSAFFHLTIGLERFLKLFVISNHMLNNNYVAPNKKELKNYGHNLFDLYKTTNKNLKDKLSSKVNLQNYTQLDIDILTFLDKYAKVLRYYNLDQLNNPIFDGHPLMEWLRISNSIYVKCIRPSTRSKITEKIIYDLDKSDYGNTYTHYLSFEDHPLTWFDVLHTQLIIKKSSPLIIWRIIELFRPIYMSFYNISEQASIFETKKSFKDLIIPHLEEFFTFFYLGKEKIIKRKKWLLFS